MEMVFRRIEYWIEGDANKQRRLDLHALGYGQDSEEPKPSYIPLISILIAHTCMAYLIGVDGLVKIVSRHPPNTLAGFLGLLFFTGIFMVCLPSSVNRHVLWFVRLVDCRAFCW